MTSSNLCERMTDLLRLYECPRIATAVPQKRSPTFAGFTREAGDPVALSQPMTLLKRNQPLAPEHTPYSHRQTHFRLSPSLLLQPGDQDSRGLNFSSASLRSMFWYARNAAAKCA